jgi:hypothetical protein
MAIDKVQASGRIHQSEICTHAVPFNSELMANFMRRSTNSIISAPVGVEVTHNLDEGERSVRTFRDLCFIRNIVDEEN